MTHPKIFIALALALGGLLAFQALAGCCLMRQIPPVGISTPP